MEPFDLRKWKSLPSQAPAVVDQIAIDSRRITSKNALFVALGGAHSDGHHYVKEALLRGARFALVQHDFSCAGIDEQSLIRVDSPLRALQAIAALYRQEMKAKVVAVIGSYGKTMTKDLLYHLVERSFPTFASPESFNSQIGVALSLLSIKKEQKIAII
ncbi:MAG: bifunctional UDP-N-acetylmuramoyl-tripeptide:D-alanyl-D-alanine ligase/alanine racemase, partial [Verrucomicrobia bacterium]|nr:bifunctional UDP-N-acetylmuramoyl-tripeptide:D-alanyl-D-alanine ligase/alanine racemase [Verrucomicrobiota bacterium]